MLIAKLPRLSPAATPKKRAARIASHATVALAAVAVVLCCGSASAQITKLFAHDDVAISGADVITTSVSGTVPGAVPPTTVVTEKASNSAVLLFSGRYTHSNLVGLEFNYGFTQFAENFSPSSTLDGPPQTAVSEFTFGYILHAPKFFGTVPFLGAGAGTMKFSPTPLGGLALPVQARMVYYGTLGLDAPFTRRFGMRTQIRDLIYMAPDYGQNYLTIGKRAQSIEPTIGFYFHF
ncbi:MAG: hypothetical protein ACYCSN_03070 [Acidobacteriaceae bacterium]